MTKTVIATALAIALALPVTANAADRIPRQFRGAWCDINETTMIKWRAPKGEGDFS